MLTPDQRRAIEFLELALLKCNQLGIGLAGVDTNLVAFPHNAADHTPIDFTTIEGGIQIVADNYAYVGSQVSAPKA